MTSPPQYTDEALHEQREWLRVTLSSIGDAVITTDTEGHVTFLNPVAQSLTGWTQEEAAGVPSGGSPAGHPVQHSAHYGTSPVGTDESAWPR